MDESYACSVFLNTDLHMMLIPTTRKSAAANSALDEYGIVGHCNQANNPNKNSTPSFKIKPIKKRKKPRLLVSRLPFNKPVQRYWVKMKMLTKPSSVKCK